MDYTKALKKRDQLENELKGIEWKIENSKRIKTNMQSWYNKKEDEYRLFLKDNNLQPVGIVLFDKRD